MRPFYAAVGHILKLLGFAAILITGCQTDSPDVLQQNSPLAPDTVTAAIGSPVSGESFSQDQIVLFSGSAVLGSSGQISRENLVWTSDQDGIIGVGNSFKRSGLSAGNHIVTLTATASSGEVGTAATQLAIEPNANSMAVLIGTPAGAHFKPYDLVELSGSAMAPDGSPVTDQLAFEWRSDLEIYPGPFLGDAPHIAPGGLTPGLHTITLSVSIPDGTGGTIIGSASIEVFVEFENSGISFEILNPANGSQLVQGHDVICTGSGSISGGGSFEEIIWTSSIDGVIGVGETCVVPYLSLGTHRLTVTATASDGRKGAASTIVEVIP